MSGRGVMSSAAPPPITPKQLAGLSPEMQVLIGAIIDHYERRIATLEAEVKALKKTPQNSSLPPGSQHPHAKPAPPKGKSKRKRGGQPGHARCERPLIPSAQCERVEELRPTACRRCGHRLVGRDAQPLRHPVWELPEIQPLVVEYRRHRLSCPCCRETTCAEALPSGFPRARAGRD